MDKREVINILMIEEDSSFVESLIASLSEIKGVLFKIQCACCIDEAEKLINKDKFHVILLDLFLTNSKGLGTLKKIRIFAPHHPVIVLTNNDDVELAVSAVRYGAQDYLIKHKLDTHLLSLAIRYAVERKRTERFQREQLHFLQSVMDNIPSPLFIKDTNLVYGACNAAFEELIGVTKENIIGKSAFEIFENEIGEMIRKVELELLSGKSKQIYELILNRYNESVNMIFHETVHKRGDGTLAGLIGVAMDISHMKDIERSLSEAKKDLEKKVKERTIELQEANEKLKRKNLKLKKVEKLLYRERRIFVNGPVVVFRISAAKKRPFEYMSPNIKQFGYGHEEFVKNDLNYYDIIHPDCRDKVVNKINSSSFTDENFFEEKFLVNKKNGESRKVYCYMNICRDANNTPVHFDGYILDITDFE